MKKRILAGILSLVMTAGLFVPMGVSATGTEGAETEEILAENVSGGTFDDTTANPEDAYVYTITGDDGSVYETTIAAETVLPEGITESETDSYYQFYPVEVDATTIEPGKYVLVNSRFYRALSSTARESKLDYITVLGGYGETFNNGETAPEKLVLNETEKAGKIEWEISTGSEGSYYIKNLSTGTYLSYGEGIANVNSTTGVDTTIRGKSTYNSEVHNGSVIIIQNNNSALNMHGGAGGYFGGHSNLNDGGAAVYLYKEVEGVIYTVDTAELQALASEVLLEECYSVDTWAVYAEELAASRTVLESSNEFTSLEEAETYHTSVNTAYTELLAAKEALETEINLVDGKYTLGQLYHVVCEENGGEFLYSEQVYTYESGQAYRKALQDAKVQFGTDEAAAEAALAALREAVKGLTLEKGAVSCFPEIDWEVTIDAARTTGDTSSMNYVENIAYVNTETYTPEGSTDVTFDPYEALPWEWSEISRLINNEDERTSPVWSQDDKGMWSREYGVTRTEDWTKGDVYKISGTFEWPEGYDLHETTIVLDSVNDFFYRDVYEYITTAGLDDYFALDQVLPINDDVYVVMWAEEEAADKPTVATINNHLALWTGTSGKGIWSKVGNTANDWARTEPATFIEWNLQGERAFYQSYPNLIGTGATKADGSEYTNTDVVGYSGDLSEYLNHTDGWYTMVDTSSINSVMRYNNPDGIDPGTEVHIDLYVMNNSGRGMIDELEIELFTEKETETSVTINYYLNTVDEEGFLGQEVLLNQEYGTEIVLLPGATAGHLNSYKAEAIYQAGYKDVSDGVQLNELIVTEGAENVVNVLYAEKGAQIIYLTAESGTFEYNENPHTLSVVTITQNGYEGTAVSLGDGKYTLPDGHKIANVYSTISRTGPGIYENNFTVNGAAEPEYVIRDEENNDITNTYTVIKTPGELRITYDPEDVTRTYDFGVENKYASTLTNLEVTATISENSEELIIDQDSWDVYYTPSAVDTGDTVDVTLTFPGGYNVIKQFNFVPASNVLYEENFVNVASVLETPEWSLDGTEGSITILDNEYTEILVGEDGVKQIEPVYGHTNANAYADPDPDDGVPTYSNGAAYKATLSLEDGAIRTRTSQAATFTFTGTGFDLISACGTNTGMLVVRVDNNAGEAVEAYLVDTYFTGDDDYIYGDGILAHQVPVVRSLDLPYGTYTVSVYGYLANTAGAVSAYSRSVATAVRQEDIVIAALDDLGMYDINVEDVEVAFIDENSVLNGGTGGITAASAVSAFSVMRMTTDLLAETSEAAVSSADVYIDGFRVYKPLETDPAIYEEDLEDGVKYQSVFDFIENSFAELEDGLYLENAFVYVEYDGAMGTASIADYKIQGPQNEVYLTPGSGIAFALDNYEVGDIVQISAKSVGYMDAGAYELGEVEIAPTATEMYYRVTPQYDTDLEQYYVTITNNGQDGILSLGNLKISSNITAMASGEVGVKLVEELENTEGAFVPELLTVSANSAVQSGRSTNISIQSSVDDVAYVTITINGEDEIELNPTNSKAVEAGKATAYKYSYAFRTRGLEEGNYTFDVVAYDANDNASEPVSVTIIVR